MAKLFPEGTHDANPGEAVVYQNDKGSLICAMRFGGSVSGQDGQLEAHEITGYFTLARPDGTLSEVGINMLKEAFGWDGCDPFWLADTDLSQVAVEIRVENYQKRDGGTGVSVEWVSKPGSGGGRMPQSGDRNAILAKFGARFRALSGGQSRSQPQQRPQAQQPAPAPQQQRIPEGVKPCSMNDAWGAFCNAAGQGHSQQEMHKLWFEAMQKYTGKKDANTLTPEEWGLVAAKADEFFGDQLPL